MKKEEFNFKKEVIKIFEKDTTFTEEELSTIYAILGIKFDEFLNICEKEILNLTGGKRNYAIEIMRHFAGDLK